jgi:hypothetical protein
VAILSREEAMASPPPLRTTSQTPSDAGTRDWEVLKDPLRWPNQVTQSTAPSALAKLVPGIQRLLSESAKEVGTMMKGSFMDKGSRSALEGSNGPDHVVPLSNGPSPASSPLDDLKNAVIAGACKKNTLPSNFIRKTVVPGKNGHLNEITDPNQVIVCVSAQNPLRSFANPRLILVNTAPEKTSPLPADSAKNFKQIYCWKVDAGTNSKLFLVHAIKTDADAGQLFMYDGVGNSKVGVVTLQVDAGVVYFSSSSDKAVEECTDIDK